MKTYFAHSPNESFNEWEPLLSHLANVANTCGRFCEDFGVFDLGYLAGVFHDIGKYQDSFQQRLKGANTTVEHSICGAKEVLQLFKQDQKSPLYSLTAELLAYVVAGHHSGLPDIGTAADNCTLPTLQARLNRATEDYSAYKNEVEFNRNVQNWVQGFLNYHQSEKAFAISILARMLYSALVDADWLETERLYHGERKYQYASFNELNQCLNKKLQAFTRSKASVIDVKRNQIQQLCKQAAQNKKGIYSLTVPTGGGKTLSSMVFALNHLLQHGHKRIIYVIPYTSIIEQTAKIFKQVFGQKNVLEHHSSFVLEDKNEYDQSVTSQSLTVENWDAPIILTTNVQFFESLFSNKRGTNRKLHNIANSVIIFDEAQMIPLQILSPCIKAVNILTLNFGCTALLMSATCPDFTPYMCQDAKITEINVKYKQHFNDFKRTNSKFLGKRSDNQIIELINFDTSTLVVVNTRRHAYKLFNSLPKECNKYHLSTLMHPKDRTNTIKKIKTDLANNLQCVVISTQLIECGVDLDFATVFRSLAGIDSIVQAGGRCNREGKNDNATVYIFEAEAESINGDIQYFKNFAREIFKNTYKEEDILSLQNIQSYFDCILNKEEAIADRQEILKQFNFGSSQFYLNFNFKNCNDLFNYIQQNDKYDIIVPNDEQSKKLLNDINFKSFATREDYLKLSQYTVSVYEHEFLSLLNNGKLTSLLQSQRCFVLNDLSLYTSSGLMVLDKCDDKLLIF